MGMIPTVVKAEAEAFGKKWNYRGVAVPQDDVSYQFATDFANVVLRSFVDMCQEKALAAMKAAKEAAEKQAIQVVE